MSEIIMGQVRFVLVTLCLGMALMLGYDILRFIRWMVPHHKLLIGAEDILYWSLMAVPAYAVFFIYNNGEIRWYGALAVLLGGILYEQGISRIVRGLGRKYLEKPKRKIQKGIVKVVRYMNVRKLYKKVHKREKKKIAKHGQIVYSKRTTKGRKAL